MPHHDPVNSAQKDPGEPAQRLVTLRQDLILQGRRVRALIDLAFESFFTRDVSLAERANVEDDAIDQVDVEIERRAVALLADATRNRHPLDEAQVRAVLTVVKVNNELERIADLGVALAQLVPGLSLRPSDVPPTFRVMTNSVIGIVRDVVSALDRTDAALARVVLHSENAVELFKDNIVRDAEAKIAGGTMSPDVAFVLHEVASLCERIADHCTNIAEQIIYAASGTIVRHTHGKWVDVPKI
jgi:phosphate transport system protein